MYRPRADYICDRCGFEYTSERHNTEVRSKGGTMTYAPFAEIIIGTEAFHLCDPPQDNPLKQKDCAQLARDFICVNTREIRHPS